MSLAAILAKRKAALAEGAASVHPAKVAEPEVPKLFSPEFPPEKEATVSILPDLEVPEPVITESRVMTFSEKMAEKKALAAKNAPLVIPATAPVPAKAPTVLSNLQQGLAEAIHKAAELPDDDAEDFARDEFKQAPAATQEGYKDIKSLVYSLSSTEDDDLPAAMSTLKKALLSNPAACLLMLDQDIGKMTIALRRVTQEALIDATKEKKVKAPGAPKKTKTTMQVALTKEQMEQVFAEL